MQNNTEYWSQKADSHHAELDRLVAEYDRADAAQDNDRCAMIAERIKTTEASIWHAEEMFDLAMLTAA